MQFQPSELRTRFAEATEQDLILPRGQLLNEARNRARRVDFEKVNGNGYEVTVGPVTLDEGEDLVAAADLVPTVPIIDFKGDYQPQPEPDEERHIKTAMRADGICEVILAFSRSEWKEWKDRVAEHKKRAGFTNGSDAALDLIRRGSPPTYDEVQARFRWWLSTGTAELEPEHEALAWRAFAAGAQFPLAGPDEAAGGARWRCIGATSTSTST